MPCGEAPVAGAKLLSPGRSSCHPIFTEVIVAPEYDGGALELLERKKNIRILVAPPYEHEDIALRPISGGVLAGATMPNQALNSSVPSPCSFRVGTWGNCSTRAAPVLPSAASLPDLTWGIAMLAEAKTPCTSPLKMPLSASEVFL